MARSLKVAPEYIFKVKEAVQRNSFPSQNALATELGLSIDTIRKFLNAKPVDYRNLVEISEKLGLDWQQIASKEEIKPLPPSPFLTGSSITQPRYFFGRQRELKRIFDNIARAMIESAKRQSAITLPPLTRKTLAVDPFTSFDEWLDKVEQTLDQNIALLSLDEFEALDDAISKGRFEEQEVLGMLRHLIQHRPRFKLLLAGSHTIEEFQRWASYLINVQVLHISYLKEPEARQLIERPVKDFTLRYEPNAVERVLQLTRCHPFLVQLLCAEIIYLKNEQDPSVRRLATLADVEAAVPAALSSGSFFFADIQINQVGAGLADNPLSQINNLSTKPAPTSGLADNPLSQINNLSTKPAPTSGLADNPLSQINNLSPKPAPTDGLAILRFIAAQGEGVTVSREVLSRQFYDNLDSMIELLLRRELIEEIGEGYRFQVELIRCWFAGKQ
ncbi:hypothetical protein [Argonema galeatum]|uniref:hypothetical protein n=1 Tax=Argonema galeatum TaxID=2942762 RepID=UPI0020118345|nr:hypothetical protein [Argonema galeatum]MCL1463230.1 hypothetical protein [Argonema galeatum A003/A1]